MEGLRDTRKNRSIAGVLAGIRMAQLPDTSPKHSGDFLYMLQILA